MDVECDFNAQGWSGEPDDECYYVLDEKTIKAHRIKPGNQITLFMKDGKEIIKCEAVLETYKQGLRARPIKGD